jgi:hypothetical protein
MQRKARRPPAVCEMLGAVARSMNCLASAVATRTCREASDAPTLLQGPHLLNRDLVQCGKVGLLHPRTDRFALGQVSEYFCALRPPNMY